MCSPLIFCHYGNTDYLRFTIACARKANPKTRIILLGDESNRWLNRYVEHHDFVSYSQGEELDTFNRVYRLVQGRDHGHEKGGRDWVNFVFKRWYYVYNFVLAHNISGFWHFDSDTMILNELGPHESKFSSIDCTEQCDGSCMNGFIATRDVVQRYLLKINELFQRKPYLDEQAREFDTTNPGYAFTEMRAFAVFRQEGNVKSTRLNRVIEDSTFDDTLVLPHGMETERLQSGVYPVEPLDATGTGDAFVSGYVFGLLQGATAVRCLEYGTAMGASCVRSMGATTGVFTRLELQQFVSSHRLQVECW